VKAKEGHDAISYLEGYQEGVGRRRMKLKSIKDLYLVKLTVLNNMEKELAKQIMSTINSVLLSEGGIKAVLYPHNGLEETILQLWDEAKNPKYIAEKLGLGEDGEEIVLCIIEDQTTQEERK